jgi:hypothetical protein
MKIDNGLVFIISFFLLIFAVFLVETFNENKTENKTKKVEWAYEPKIRCIDGVSYISLPRQLSVKLDKNSKIIPCETHGE